MRNDNLLLIFQFYRTHGNDTKNLKKNIHEDSYGKLLPSNACSIHQKIYLTFFQELPRKNY